MGLSGKVRQHARQSAEAWPCPHVRAIPARCSAGGASPPRYPRAKTPPRNGGTWWRHRSPTHWWNGGQQGAATPCAPRWSSPSPFLSPPRLPPTPKGTISVTNTISTASGALQTIFDVSRCRLSEEACDGREPSTRTRRGWNRLGHVGSKTILRAERVPLGHSLTLGPPVRIPCARVVDARTALPGRAPRKRKPGRVYRRFAPGSPSPNSSPLYPPSGTNSWIFGFVYVFVSCDRFVNPL